jgi:hypothetical protein
MNKLNMTAISAAIALAFGGGALASGLSKADYQAGKTTIATEYKSAATGCSAFSANAKDVCIAEAKGNESVAKAELEARYQPTSKARYNVSVAKAEADYAVAKEKCDDKAGNDKAGNDKDVCLKEAKSAEIAAKADAKATLKTADAEHAAKKKTAAARMKANEERAEAKQTAATDKRNAEYAVAREKCDTFADDAKTTCIKDAKTRYGQS